MDMILLFWCLLLTKYGTCSNELGSNGPVCKEDNDCFNVSFGKVDVDLVCRDSNYNSCRHSTFLNITHITCIAIGKQSCILINLENIDHVYCDEFQSCQFNNFTSLINVHCKGFQSCINSTFINTINVDCSAMDSCLHSTISNHDMIVGNIQCNCNGCCHYSTFSKIQIIQCNNNDGACNYSKFQQVYVVKCNGKNTCNHDTCGNSNSIQVNILTCDNLNACRGLILDVNKTKNITCTGAHSCDDSSFTDIDSVSCLETKGCKAAMMKNVSCIYCNNNGRCDESKMLAILITNITCNGDNSCESTCNKTSSNRNETRF